MKQLLTILSAFIILASCQKIEKTAPYNVPDPCEFNNGMGNVFFTSQHYNLTQNYSVKKCEINMYFKSTKIHPFKSWFYSSLEIKNDSISIGIDSIARFLVSNADTFDRFDDHTPIDINYHQVRMTTNINDPELYGYISNNLPGSVFQITSMTDTTISGNYSIHVSRLTRSPSGSNFDSHDTSILQGSFTNLKIIPKNID